MIHSGSLPLLILDVAFALGLLGGVALVATGRFSRLHAAAGPGGSR